MSAGNKTRLEYLFERYFSEKTTPEEKSELAKLVGENNDEELIGLLTKTWGRFETTDTIISLEKTKMILQRILNKQETKIRRMFPLRRVAAAASIILALGTGSYFLFFKKTEKPTDIVKINDTVPHDVAAPNVARATLKLDDGTIIYLDSAKNGSLALQGKINILKLANGQIAYKGSLRQAQGDKEIKYNTIYNPRGSKVQSLTLIDGTQVWLNAESSLTYPTAFVGNERKVSITGEAYFEVTHDATKPFIVSKADVDVTVLGTHFNVNAYDDEETIKVTLLEGSVKVNNGADSKMIKPGEQAYTIGNGQLVISKNADLEQVMAWKNGKFQFNDASIETIMKEIARWYDAEVAYEGKISGHFVADISRDVPVSKLLHILELTNRVHFNIEGKKVTVMK